MSDRSKWNVRVERNMVRKVPSPPGPFKRRAKTLRRAWRTFSWMVLRPRESARRGRRGYTGVALREAWCGLWTGGDHWWGPLRREYPEARRRQRKCRLCRASMTPASEIEPPTEEERREAEELIYKPKDEADAARLQAEAIRVAEREGILRNGKWLWD